MPTFVLRKIEGVDGKQAFYKLVIDGVCDLDDFEASLEIRYESEIGSMYYQMQRVADLQKLAASDYRPRKDLHDDAFEIKTKNLRYYGMHVRSTGKAIIVCGYKNRQARDERRVKKLIPLCINDHVIEQIKAIKEDET